MEHESAQNTKQSCFSHVNHFPMLSTISQCHFASRLHAALLPLLMTELYKHQHYSRLAPIYTACCQALPPVLRYQGGLQLLCSSFPDLSMGQELHLPSHAELFWTYRSKCYYLCTTKGHEIRWQLPEQSNDGSLFVLKVHK